MAKRAATKYLLKLPNAPLVEVVFEFRWALIGGENIPSPLKQDPGYPLLQPAFAAAARKRGFSLRRNISEDPTTITGGHTVGVRFYKGEDQPYPLWQIGPGIFASNVSTNYVWPEYKQLCLSGVDVLYQSYPKSKSASIEPVYLELRYVDMFNEDAIGTTDLGVFLKNHTNAQLDLKPLIDSNLFEGAVGGRLQLSRRIKGEKAMLFLLDLASGTVGGQKGVVMTTKVFTRDDNLQLPKNAPARQKYLSNWLDKAHAVTSPFFRNFVSESLMQRFKIRRGSHV